MDYRLKITMHSDWHCGSGLAAGSDVDALVIKDRDELPYIPGKTLKGLIRQAVEEVAAFEGDGERSEDIIRKNFGFFENDATKAQRGSSFFADAILEDNERQAIIANKAARYMYRNLASTAIDRNTGVAKDHSLRQIQVTVPCTLYAQVQGVSEDMKPLFEKSIKYIKRLGLDRTRGLGRCTIEIE